jgi:hypothetical protein
MLWRCIRLLRRVRCCIGTFPHFCEITKLSTNIFAKIKR